MPQSRSTGANSPSQDVCPGEQAMVKCGHGVSQHTLWLKASTINHTSQGCHISPKAAVLEHSWTNSSHLLTSRCLSEGRMERLTCEFYLNASTIAIQRDVPDLYALKQQVFNILEPFFNNSSHLLIWRCPSGGRRDGQMWPWIGSPFKQFT